MTEIIYDYHPPVSKLLTAGDCREMSEWPDYLALGLSPEHIPELIRMALDETLYWADSESEEVWANVHAWRALGQLQAQEAAAALLPLFNRIDEDGNDWVDDELPEVYGMIGPVTIPTLAASLADSTYGLWARVNMAKALAEVAQRHPAARAECVAVLTHQLEQYARQDPTLNAFILSPLVDLQAVESAPVMERAFAAEDIDLSVMGDWEDVQIDLGMLAERLTPKPRLGFFDWGRNLPKLDNGADSSAAQRRAKAQSRQQAKTKTRVKNKQASKQRAQQRKKKKK